MIITVRGRRIRIHDREEWQDPRYPVTGPSPYPSLVHHAVIHWPGADDDWVPDTDVAAHLRWAHALYLLDPNRGYSYGYGFVCGPNRIDWSDDPVQTDIWEVRGTDIRIASNDGDNGVYGQYRNPNFNGRSNSLQLMASTNHPATSDQIEQARYWVAYMDQVYGETLEVIPHRTSDATSCPGNFITSNIPRIATRPAVIDPSPTTPPAVDRPGKVTTMKALVLRYGGKPTGGWSGYYSLDGGITRLGITSMHQANQIMALGAIDARTLQPVTSWNNVTHTNNPEELDEWLTPGRD